MVRTGNPALSASTFGSVARARGEEAMTVEGTINKTGISLLILILAAALSWNGVFGQENLPAIMLVGLVGGLVVALATVFKKEWAPVTTPLYAVLEGLLLGAISLVFNLRYPEGWQGEFDVAPEAPLGVKRRAEVEEIEPGSRVRSRSLG